MLNYGTSNILDLSESHKQRFFNLFFLLAIPTNLVSAIYNYYKDYYFVSIINIIQIIIFGLAIYLTSKNKYLYLRTCTLLLLSFTVIATAIYGNSGMEYRLMILMVPAVVLFDNKVKFIAFNLLMSIAFTYCRVIDLIQLGLNQNIVIITKSVQIFIPFILTYTTLFYFKKLYVKSQFKLEIAMNEVSKSNEMKERIMYSLAHDLRSPLSNVIAASQFLKDQNDISDIQMEFLNIIELSSTHSSAMIKELMDSNQMLMKQQQTQLISLNEMLSNVVTMSVFKAEEKNISVEFDASKCTGVVMADSFKIDRLFTNLLNNAIKFSPKSSVIQVAVTNENNHVIVSIKDQGVGIPEKHIGIIFDPFTKAKRVGTENEPSYGLGLSICKQIVELHGGIINVFSELGKGSEFIVRLPNAN